MHGEPCFAGTRVTLKTFFDHLQASYTIDGFTKSFPPSAVRNYLLCSTYFVKTPSV